MTRRGAPRSRRLPSPTITGELKRHFRDHGWHPHVPRALQEQILQVRFVEAGLLEELGRSATASELAYRLGWTVEAVLEVRAATAAIQVDSLEKPFQTEDGQLRLGDRLGAADPRLLAADDLLLVRDGLNRLSPRDRMIVVLRLEHDLTQEEIAARVGLSQMHVSRIIRKALTR